MTPNLGTQTAESVIIQVYLFNIIASIIILLLLALAIYNYRSFSLQIKFILTIIFLTAGGIAASSVVVSNSTGRILTQNIESDLRNLADFRANSLGTILAQAAQSHQALHSNRNMKVSVIQQNQAFERLTESEQTEFVSDREATWQTTPDSNRGALIDVNVEIDIEIFQTAFPEHQNIIVTDRYGSLVAASIKPERFNHADTDWWQSSFADGAGQIYFGVPILSEDNIVYVPIATPIYATTIFPESEPIGILYSEYDLTNDILLFTDSTINQGEVFASLLINDMVIESLDGVIRQYANPLSTADTANLTQNQVLTADYLNTERLLGFSLVQTNKPIEEINNLDWGIIVSRTTQSTREFINAQQRTQNFIGILIIVVGIGLAYIVSQLVSAPILRLANVADQLASGQRGARAVIETGDEIATLAQTLNLLAERTEEDIELLELRVSERTQALETSFRISQTLSTILDRNQLLEEVIQQLQKVFDFYHVHIYLIDEATGCLHFVRGSGSIGYQLQIQKHKIELGRGLVGQAGQTNLTYLVPDVQQNPSWLPNELLPNTVAEIAVPISIGPKVFGVIDVQEDRFGRINAQIQQLLEAVAAQTAVALRNAEYVEEAQERAKREALINGIRNKIRQTDNVDLALKTAVRELGKALKDTQARVNLKKPNKPHTP